MTVTQDSTGKITEDQPSTNTDVTVLVSGILGYDVATIGSDVYERAASRLANPSASIPAEDVLGPLDQE